MTDLQDRVALVTGSSSGLGYAAARALIERGTRVALNSRGGKKLFSTFLHLASRNAPSRCHGMWQLIAQL